MGPFNNRELATAIWLLVFAVWALRKSEVRRSIGGVFRAFWRFKIVVPVCLMTIYITAIVVLLERIGMWEVGLLKDTIVWFFAGAMVMMVRFATADDTENIFRKILTDSIKIVILLEFLVNTYTFPLIVELILVPLFTFITMIDVVANMKEEHAIVAKLTKGIQVIAGFVILGIAVNRAFADFQNLKSLDTFRSITLAPLLSVLMFPFIYIMLVISKYELMFIRLKLGREKSRSLKRYARRRIIMHAGLSLKRIQHLLGNHVIDLMHIEKESDVDSFLRQTGNPDAKESGGNNGKPGNKRPFIDGI
jgi:hypothetical protein